MAFGKKSTEGNRSEVENGLNYTEVDKLKKYLTPDGKIVSARRNGLSAKLQRRLVRQIKKARSSGLLYFRNPEA